MKNLFSRIYNWGIAILLQYQELKTKKFERHNCHYCGKRYLFDLPVGVPIEQIVFVCKSCNPIHEKMWKDQELVPQFPSGGIPLSIVPFDKDWSTINWESNCCKSTFTIHNADTDQRFVCDKCSNETLLKLKE